MTRILKLLMVSLTVANCAADPYADLRKPEAAARAEAAGEAPLPPPKPGLTMSDVLVPVAIVGAFVVMALGAVVRR